MTSVWRPFHKALAGLFVAAMCGSAQGTMSARPGTINYIEGRAFLDGQLIQQNQVGHIGLDANQSIRTDSGSKAEVLLTPGVFLRLGQDAEVRMVAPSLTDTRVAVTKGEALVDVAQLFKDNNIQVMNDGASTRLLKTGLYRFNADTSQVAVIDGKASVQNGDSRVDLGKGKQVTVTSEKLRAEKFNTKQEDDLYAWSNLRSEYSAEASYATARNITVNNYGGWGMGYGAGWFWNPYYSSWAFIPASGYFYDPFGWGFFSPRYVYAAPLYYGGWRNRPIPVNPGRLPAVAGVHNGFRPGLGGPAVVAQPRVMSGFRSAPMGRAVMPAPHFGGGARTQR